MRPGRIGGCSKIVQKNPKSECPDVWIRLPRQKKGSKSWEKIEDTVVLFERNLYGHPSAVLLWERQFEEVSVELGWEKIPNCEFMFVHRKQGLFLSVFVDDIKMAEQKQNLAPMWKRLMKHKDIDEPISFLDHVYLGCKPNEAIIERLARLISCVFITQMTIVNIVMWGHGIAL